MKHKEVAQYNAKFHNNDNDKKRGRPAGGMSREHDSFETQQSNHHMWKNQSQRINIVYIKVDSSITKFLWL